jgi:membrane dipeptidase
LAGCLLALISGPIQSQNLSPVVRQMHHKAIVIDTHTDTPMKLLEDQFNLAECHKAPSRVDIPRLQAGDVDAIFFALYTHQGERNPAGYANAYQMANRMLDSTRNAAERNSEKVKMAVSPDEIVSCSNQGKIAICLGMENGFPLARDINRVREFYEKGVRYITLCHSANNDICDSSNDPNGSEHDGLSSFGRQVVEEMNRLGMIIDVSHISDKSFYDVINLSKAPVIASHSSVRSVCDNPRNMSDDMIKALAGNGGVIQICILGSYIAPDDTTSENYKQIQALRLRYNNFRYRDEKEREEAWREWDSIQLAYPPVLPTVAQAVDHIDYVVKLAGIDHVGIGSDFDGGGALADCADVADFPNITAELVKRGYSQQDIDKIWGGNFLRVFREVEKRKALTVTP